MYNVIVLAEQPLSELDARQVVSLHDGIDEERHYHLLIPCENAAARVESALSALAASDLMAAPPSTVGAEDIEAAQREIDAEASNCVQSSIRQIQRLGQAASGEFSPEEPIDALEQVVAKYDIGEIIVLTRPHVVRDFLHIDWASKARRRLGVPVLHLFEHEPFDAEAGTGQGITGM